ncbi:Piso0_005873 [Millerozyma farinosa CBS 7064]|uniref:Piso0_005873 protein n=1 Tax=Pichia sorbitophila (strain ATCC MYA-4447 / BCRC 22081 / CBS 7064 / NBRC 10061 / NRRL Y-12695) TaxID=559304 RepID=G8Y355_PICSO|nr:Piso0_005873 [Millerozyma farinosa CBS 7064]
MSNNDGDPTDLKAKYAEIAALKKSIDEKKAIRNASLNSKDGKKTIGTNYISKGQNQHKPRPYSSGFNYYKGFVGNKGSYHRNMTAVFNGQGQDEKNTETSDTKYVSSISKSGMSLVTSDIYKQDQSKLKQLNEEIKNKKLEAAKARRLKALENIISKNRMSTDSCDRIKLDGDIFAVSNHGDKLVALSLPRGDRPKVIVWNGENYIRKSNGNLKRSVSHRRRYVLHLFVSVEHLLTIIGISLSTVDILQEQVSIFGIV